MIQPKDVPDIDLLKSQKAINRIDEVAELNCETVQVPQIDSEQTNRDNIEKPIYHGGFQDGVKRSNTMRVGHAQVSEKSDNLLNCLGISVGVLDSANDEEGEVQEQVKGNNTMMTGHAQGSKNSNNLLIHYHNSADEGERSRRQL